MTAEPFLASVEALFAARGATQYGGEAVSQLDHALQAAWAAERAGDPPELIAAALLHDVGHLLHPDDERHEELGHRFLATAFGPAVTEPVRLHVPAKRYLCTAEPGYVETLSPESVRSLGVQGGSMSAAEAAEFRRGPHFEAAVRLRRFDEAAKVPGLATPGFGHFRKYLEAALCRPNGASGNSQG
jgi:phosphonate degradation associated HDIG domain protein